MDYYPTLLGGTVLVLEDHQMGADGVVSSEMDLYSPNLLHTFLKPLLHPLVYSTTRKVMVFGFVIVVVGLFNNICHKISRHNICQHNSMAIMTATAMCLP